jgi:hypothetical protein
MFKKVTKDDIEEYLKKFRGSQQEMEDIKRAYLKYKGDVNKIIESVIGADVQNEDSLVVLILFFLIKKKEFVKLYATLLSSENFHHFQNIKMKSQFHVLNV